MATQKQPALKGASISGSTSSGAAPLPAVTPQMQVQRAADLAAGKKLMAQQQQSLSTPYNYNPSTTNSLFGQVSQAANAVPGARQQPVLSGGSIPGSTPSEVAPLPPIGAQPVLSGGSIPGSTPTGATPLPPAGAPTQPVLSGESIPGYTSPYAPPLPPAMTQQQQFGQQLAHPAIGNSDISALLHRLLGGVQPPQNPYTQFLATLPYLK